MQLKTDWTKRKGRFNPFLLAIRKHDIVPFHNRSGLSLKACKLYRLGFLVTDVQRHAQSFKILQCHLASLKGWCHTDDAPNRPHHIEDGYHIPGQSLRGHRHHRWKQKDYEANEGIK